MSASPPHCITTRDLNLWYGKFQALINVNLAIQDGLIAAVGPTAEIVPANPDARFLDAQGRIIMPGLINTHTHLYSAFARGMALKDDAPGNFMQILERLWWRLDKALTLDDVYWSAMAGMVECIRNGVTTVFDHHSSPHAVRVSLFRIAEAARQTGLRACLCYEVSDRDGAEIATQGIEENRAFLETCIRRPESLIRGLFGLHASFTLGDATLAQCREAAADLGAGFHVHTAEALSDVDHCLREHNIGVVERWRQRGILGPHTLAAHCVHVSEREIGGDGAEREHGGFSECHMNSPRLEMRLPAEGCVRSQSLKTNLLAGRAWRGRSAHRRAA